MLISKKTILYLGKFCLKVKRKKIFCLHFLMFSYRIPWYMDDKNMVRGNLSITYGHSVWILIPPCPKGEKLWSGQEFLTERILDLDLQS